MSHSIGQIRTPETVSDIGWPPRTQGVSHIGDACVVHGSCDFDLSDLIAVRGRFPDRRVTLDGDVITVWPPFQQQ